MANLDDLRIAGPVPRPQRRRGWSPWQTILLLALLALLGWSLRGYLGGFAGLGTAGKLLARLAPRSEVQVLTVPQPQDHAGGTLTAGGYLEVIPPGPQLVSTLVAGKLSSIAVVPGQAVQAGQVVARLDAALYQQQAAVLAARVELAESELRRQQAGFRTQEVDQAQAELVSAQAVLTRTEADHRRSEELYQAGVISRVDFDASLSALEQARAAVAAQQSVLSLRQAGTRTEDVAIYRAAVNAAQAELSQVQYLIGQCVLRSPAGGVVFELHAQPGDWLAPEAGDPLAGAVASVIDPGQVQAWVDVNQRDSAQVFEGQAVALSSDAAPQREVAGRVLRVMPKANLQKNTVEVKVQIADPPPDFRPGLAVKVVFQPAADASPAAAATAASVLLPATALVAGTTGSGVFLAVNGQAVWQPVEAGTASNDQVEIIGGLAPGAVVIVNPAGLKDGQAIVVAATPQEAQ